jgi:hypothetical protein
MLDNLDIAGRAHRSKTSLIAPDIEPGRADDVR